MIVVANRIPVNPGYETEFEARFGENSSVKDQPGFIRNLVLRPVQGDSYIVMTFWEDQASFRAWTASESFRASHRGGLPVDAFRDRPTLEIHEIIRDSEQD